MGPPEFSPPKTPLRTPQETQDKVLFIDPAAAIAKVLHLLSVCVCVCVCACVCVCVRLCVYECVYVY